MALALIPARGGSKRVPRKNIRMMNGRPLIEWSIETSIESGVFDEVVVSTDDLEIRDIALAAGASVPFIRPRELAGDETPTLPVVQHALNFLGNMGRFPTETCCIYPSAIFVTVDDLKASFETLLSPGDHKSVISVSKYSHPVQRALGLAATGHLESREPDSDLVRTQDLREYWHDAGQFYWARSSVWTTISGLLPNRLPFELAAWRVQDIDTEDDWIRAEFIHSLVLRSS